MNRLASVVAVALVCSHIAAAQRGPALSLPAATGRLSEEFTSIVGVRELADGRVLISDDRETRVVVADFAANRATVLGRTGSGPAEYKRANVLFPLSNDSTAMSEDNGGNWILFTGATIAGRLTPDKSIGKSRLAMISGFDSQGNALFTTMAPASAGQPSNDSLIIQLHARPSHAEQTIGRARSPYARAVAARGGFAYERKATGGPTMPVGFFLMDRAVLFADGWVAVVRLQPYRVDWRAPDGKVTTGATIAPSGAYEASDQTAYLQREAVASGKPARELANVTGWPAFLPAFAGVVSPVFAGPDGKVWIERTVTAAEPGNRYDVVDRRGALSGVLVLPANERVVGFGAKTIYVAVTDGDGIQRLRRHPRP
jgi:hypothetical protein